MGRKCNVKDCPSDTNRPEDTGVTFHKTPLHPDLRPKWISLCRIADDKAHHRVIYVCSRHFLRADFCSFKGTKYMLRQGALPSVFPWTKVLPKVSKSEAKSKSSKNASASKGKETEKGTKSETVKECSEAEGQSEEDIKKENKGIKEIKTIKEMEKKFKVEIKRIEKEMTNNEPVKSKIEMKIEKDVPEIIQTQIKLEKADGEEKVDDSLKLDADNSPETIKSEVESEVVEETTTVKSSKKVEDNNTQPTKVKDNKIKSEVKEEDKKTTIPNKVMVPEKKTPKHGTRSTSKTPVAAAPTPPVAPPAAPPVDIAPKIVKALSQSPSSTAISFVPGLKIEALDFNQCWYPARVVEVDYDDHEVLIHFEKFSHRFDEWIQMDSPRLRPLQINMNKGSEIFVVNERCMAVWSDSRKFPATVTRALPESDSYEVLFDDGFIKCLKSSKLSKMTDVPQHLHPTSMLMAKAAPLFEPAKGSKQERRDRKRKIASVAELFSLKKRHKVEAPVDEVAPVPHVEIVAQQQLSTSDVEADEWACRWMNGEPVGTAAVLESHDGQRKSVIVQDHRLPDEWQKHFVQRPYGTSAGKWDCVIVNPDGRRFRTKTEIQKYIEANPHFNFTLEQFDFSLHLQRARKLGLYEMNQKEKSTPPRTKTSLVSVTPIVDVVEAESQEEESSSSLKIPWENDSFKCPIEGCGKNFRKENLAQMHVKHYHPEYSQLMGSTPNVADLAYARTVGESLEKPPPAPVERARAPVVPKTPTSTPKLLSPNDQQQEKAAATPATAAAVANSKQKDSEIIKLLNKPSSYDYKSDIFDSQSINDAKLRDLLCKPEGASRFDDTPTRVGGIKTLLPVVRRLDAKDIMHQPPFPPHSSKPKQQEKAAAAAAAASAACAYDDSEALLKPYPSTRNVKRRRPPVDGYDQPPTGKKKVDMVAVEQQQQFDVKEEPSGGGVVAGEAAPTQDVIIEGGEVIKIVHMRREEIINCTCGITEEDGLMIQCEMCCCWQHAYCNGIERESQVPEKYICYICQNPTRQRLSKKHFHDQDWLKHGNLPSANYHCKDEESLRKRFDMLKKSHQLSGGLVELKDFIHSLRVKINIAETKNHPKLYLWSKIWDKPALAKAIKVEGNDAAKDKLNTSTDSSGYMKSNDLENILNVLSMLKPEDIPVAVQPPVAPQPEAAIESADCRLNLLEHIEHCQKHVDQRLDDFEAQIDAMERANFGAETDDSYPRTKQTMLMLLKDLGTMRQLATMN